MQLVDKGWVQPGEGDWLCENVVMLEESYSSDDFFIKGVDGCGIDGDFLKRPGVDVLLQAATNFVFREVHLDGKTVFIHVPDLLTRKSRSPGTVFMYEGTAESAEVEAEGGGLERARFEDDSVGKATDDSGDHRFPAKPVVKGEDHLCAGRDRD